MHSYIALVVLALAFGCSSRSGSRPGSGGDGAVAAETSISATFASFGTTMQGEFVVAAGNNSPKAWCGRDGVWDFGGDQRRVENGVIECPPADFRGNEREDKRSCATWSDASTCRFAIQEVLDLCVDQTCSDTHVIDARCTLDVVTETIMRGSCVTDFGAESTTADLEATWLSQ